MAGRRPLSPRQLKKMQGQMKTTELKGVTEVIIRLQDKEIVIPNPDVSKIILGAEMYQVVGQGMERPLGSDKIDETTEVEKPEVTEADIKLVMKQTGASKKEVIQALEAENGDLAGAIVRLKTK